MAKPTSIELDDKLGDQDGELNLPLTFRPLSPATSDYDSTGVQVMDESVRPLIDKKYRLLKKLIHVIEDGRHERSYLNVLGSLAMIAGDNAFTFWLSSTTAETIGDFLKLSGRDTDLLSILMIANGCVVITAVDLYSSTGLIKNMISILKRLSITPGYLRRFLFTSLVSAVVSFFAASSTGNIILIQYQNNIALAASLSICWLLINMTTGVFYGQEQFNSLRKLLKTTQPDEKLPALISSVNKVSENLRKLSISEYKNFSSELSQFKKDPSDDNLISILHHLVDIKAKNFSLNELEPTILVGTVSADLPKRKKMSCTDMSSLLFSSFIAISGTYIFFNTGKQSYINLFDELDKPEPPGLSSFAGICLAGIYGITVSFSSREFTKKCINSVTDFFFPRKRISRIENLILIGKALTIFLCSTLYSLGTITLVDYAVQPNSLSARVFWYAIAVVQELNVRALALSEISPRRYATVFYQSLANCFVKNWDREKNLLADNLSEIGQTFTLATNQDISSLYEAFNECRLIEQEDDSKDLFTPELF